MVQQVRIRGPNAANADRSLALSGGGSGACSTGKLFVCLGLVHTSDITT